MTFGLIFEHDIVSRELNVQNVVDMLKIIVPEVSPLYASLTTEYLSTTSALTMTFGVEPDMATANTIQQSVSGLIQTLNPQELYGQIQNIPITTLLSTQYNSLFPEIGTTNTCVVLLGSRTSAGSIDVLSRIDESQAPAQCRIGSGSLFRVDHSWPTESSPGYALVDPSSVTVQMDVSITNSTRISQKLRGVELVTFGQGNLGLAAKNNTSDELGTLCYLTRPDKTTTLSWPAGEYLQSSTVVYDLTAENTLVVGYTLVTVSNTLTTTNVRTPTNTSIVLIESLFDNSVCTTCIVSPGGNVSYLIQTRSIAVSPLVVSASGSMLAITSAAVGLYRIRILG